MECAAAARSIEVPCLPDSVEQQCPESRYKSSWSQWDHCYALSPLPTICTRSLVTTTITSQPIFITTALACKQAWWILAILIDVAEHRRCAAVAFIVEILTERARELRESSAAEGGREIRPFALACNDCVVLELKVHRATWDIQTDTVKHACLLSLDRNYETWAEVSAITML